MRLHRFYKEFNTKDGEIEIKDKGLINQLKNVFRLKRGGEIILFNGKGDEVLVSIKDITSDVVKVEVKKMSKNESESKNSVTLCCSILKKENFEWVVEKATEVGVKEIVPVTTGRTVKFNLNFERIKKIAKEAAEQSGRAIVPEIKEVIKFEDALKQIDKNDTNIIFDISGDSPATWKSYFQVDKNINIFIGPEGGWEDFEIEKSKEAGFKILSLGKTTLRGETAAIIASYLAVNLT